MTQEAQLVENREAILNNKDISNTSIWHRSLKYIRPYTWKIIYAIIGMVLTIIANIMVPIVCGWLIDHTLANGSVKIFVILVVLRGMLPMTEYFMGAIQEYFTSSIAEGLANDLRNAMHQKLLCMSQQFYAKNKVGELMSRFTSDAKALSEIASNSFPYFVSNIFFFIGSCWVCISIDWQIAILIVAIYSLNFIPARLFSAKLQTLSKEKQTFWSSMNGIFNETLAGIKVIQAFSVEERQSRNFQECHEHMTQVSLKEAKISRFIDVWTGAVRAFGPGLIFLLGGLKAIQGDLSIGVVVWTLGAMTTRLFMPIQSFSDLLVKVKKAKPLIERVFEYVELIPEITDSDNAVELKDCMGDLNFKNVKFSYNSDIVVLENISFEIKPGRIIALVGLSGSGKSTIADLTPRFYDPDEGSILLDGYDLRSIKLSDLRSHIGFVTQDTFLFNGSVADNIRYGKVDANMDKIISAAKAAYIHDIIDALPDKYETEVGERGSRFSGGQQQRIAIARVILMNPKVLVLDEATSALDMESERYIQMALDKLMEGRTSLVIAHRLSTVMHADEILVLDNGKIVQRGTHKDLLQEEGPYQRLYQNQFQE